MTHIEELKKTAKHLSEARASVQKAIQAAVLSRHRHADLNRIESRLLSVLGEISEELESRGVDPGEAWTT